MFYFSEKLPGEVTKLLNEKFPPTKALEKESGESDTHRIKKFIMEHDILRVHDESRLGKYVQDQRSRYKKKQSN